MYADAIEQTFYNALLGSMKDDGSDWSKYTPLQGKRLMGEGQCGMGINCCVASGPRGLFTIPLTTVMQHREGASVNFFIAGEYGIKTPSQHSDILWCAIHRHDASSHVEDHPDPVARCPFSLDSYKFPERNIFCGIPIHGHK